MDADQAKYAERTYDQYAELYFDRIPYPSPTGIKTVLESLARELQLSSTEYVYGVTFIWMSPNHFSSVDNFMFSIISSMRSAYQTSPNPNASFPQLRVAEKTPKKDDTGV